MDQHKVPALSLRHFADQKGEVWTYDKTRGKCWPAIPERTSVEAHYYSVEREDGTMDTSLEEAISEVEGAAAPAYEKLTQGVMPKGSDREAFGHFLGLMYARTPAMRRLAVSVHKQNMESVISMRARHPQSFPQLLKHLAAKGHDVSDPEAVREQLTDLSHSELLVPRSWALQIIGGSEKYAEIFLGMKWSLGQAEHHYFITCDSPIYLAIDPATEHPVYGGHGLLNRTAEITMAISRKRTLIMHWEAQAPYEVMLSRKWVEKENEKRAYSAEREVYSHLEHKDLVRLVAAFKGKGPQIRFSGPSGVEGFAGARVPRRWTSGKKISKA